MKSLFVFDFGGQYAHLIANRIRRCGAYSEIVQSDISAEELKKKNPAGIIFSGGPHSVFEEDSPQVDPQIFELSIPILGICYGHQLIAKTLGGLVEKGETHEFGKSSFCPISPQKEKVFEGIFKNFPEKSVMWMSHGDHVICLPEKFERAGETEDCHVAAMANYEKNIYGVQFHPEVTHSEKGMQLLENFVEICGLKGSWTLENFIETEIKKIQKKCEGKKVFLLVSGGVDSSVCFALLEKALGKNRVFGCLIDHGMMRKNEAQEVREMLSEAGFNDLHIENAAEKFLSALRGKTAPEEKRQIIGNTFLEVQSEVAERLNLNPKEWMIGQGTIYPDTIESGGTRHSSKIKTHHNRVERIEQLIKEGKIIEPIVDLYKDEVRETGKTLGLPEKLISRHPFPGPGLGVRILCAEGPDYFKNSEILGEKITEKYPEITDAFILPIRSVGVQGDGRTYRHPCSLYFHLPPSSEEQDENFWQKFEQIATEISNETPEINRVILCLSHKYPENFEVKKTSITPERVKILQEVDRIVREEISLSHNEIVKRIWQFPVVLIPLFHNEKESIILRPIESENAMTANFSHLPWDFLKKISDKIQNECDISHIFYDLTNKPPGTIEWE